MRLNLIIVSLFIFSLCHSQNPDSLRAIQLSEKGLEFAEKDEFRKSIPYFKEAVKIFEDISLFDLALKHRNNLMQAYIQNADFEKAVDEGKIGVTISDSLQFLDHKDSFHRRLGIVYKELSKFDQALYFFRLSENYRRDRYGEKEILYAKSLNATANILIVKQQYREAEEKLKQGINIMEEIGSSAEQDKIFLLQTLGALYHAKGQFDKMLECNEKGLQNSLRLVGENDLLTAFAYQNVGLSYANLDEPQKSIAYHEKSITIRKNLLGQHHPILIDNYNGISHNYIKISNGELALSAAQKSYEISKIHFSDLHESSLRALSNMIASYNIMGNTVMARELIDKSIELTIKLYGRNHKLTALAYHQFGDIYRFGGEPLNAIPYYEKSIEILLKLGQVTSQLSSVYQALTWTYYYSGDYSIGLESANMGLKTSIAHDINFNKMGWPRLDNYLSYSTLHSAIQAKTFILYMLANKYPERKVEYFESALNGSKLMDSLMIDQQKKISINEDRLRFASDSHEAIHGALYVLWTLFEETGDTKFHSDIFYFNERSKSNILFARAISEKARKFAGLPEYILKKEKDLQDSIMNAKNAFLSSLENQSDSLQQLSKSKLFKKEREYHELQMSIKEQYPNYYEIKYAQTPVQVSEVQDFVSRQSRTVLVEYFVNAGSIFISVISSDTIASYSIDFDQRNSMTNRVIEFRESLINVDDSLFQKHTKELYSLLFQPINELIKTINPQSIIIIPDGALNYLPFELLSSDEGRYIMEDFNFYYAPSASILLNKKRQNSGRNLISYAPKFSPSGSSQDNVRENISALPGALDEVLNLSEIFNNKSVLNNAATESSFYQEAPNFDLIHLATHAIIDESIDENARLIFSLHGDSLNDGYLHAYEIYNLDLNAQLVTLSACNTGFGKIRKGEGVMSLSRAFAYAGVPATVVSLWPASDKSTPELMKYFYQNLKDGQAKDVALNNARKQYLATAKGKARHPFYWGGFVLIGDNSPIEEDKNLLIWLIPSVLIIVMILTVYRRKRKTKADLAA